MTNEEILNAPMGDNDSGAETIKEYLKALLEKLWEKGEGFSGKRPFGNSGWEYDLYDALEKLGIEDRIEQNTAIYEAIDSL